ncbi:MAG: hypothetical protein KF683_07490, partial [Rubrivivax sp.]|nr:hypothetical protein [Rubrivivax sp.]
MAGWTPRLPPRLRQWLPGDAPPRRRSDDDAERRRYAEQSQVATDILRRLQQQRDEAAASRTRFLAAAAHDLRQPLSAVTIYADLLSQRLRAAEHADAQALDYLRTLRQEIRA